MMEWMWLIGCEVVRRFDCFCEKVYREAKWKLRTNKEMN